MRRYRGRVERKKKHQDIAPDEIFLDARNTPGFDTTRLEGRLERPLAYRAITTLSIIFALIGLVFIGKLWHLQIAQGDGFYTQSELNRLDHDLVFARRGSIYDRNGTVLAGNKTAGTREVFPERAYAGTDGIAHAIGFLRYPQQDAKGIYFETEAEGRGGIEAFYDGVLAGENGSLIVETNAVGELVSASTFEPPEDGTDVRLTIDADISNFLYGAIQGLAEQAGFTGGAGVILDVTDGSVLALVNYPEFDLQVMTDGEDEESITAAVNSEAQPFLNRAIAGLYAPGSIVKPFVAVGALDTGVVTPETEIVSTGELRVPNPFNPDQPTIFRDWRAHGATDIREALAVSSDVYFYQVGGGFQDQQGIGISGIEKYARMFGLAMSTGIDLGTDPEGVIPNPSWKEEHFSGDPWRVGDTYNTSIGQYGFQVTPLQMARATAAIANGGTLVTPHIREGTNGQQEPIGISRDILQIVREGMRMAVTEGTASGLSMPAVSIAGKTGTAEIGSGAIVNSWVIGFFPYENPRYAFATVMERGPESNLVGATYVMRQLFDWMRTNKPELLAG